MPASWTVSAVALVALMALTLSTDVYGNRGRDEISLLTIDELPLAPGDAVSQPVVMQLPQPYAIKLPYRWYGAASARINVTMLGADGSVLSATTETLSRSRRPIVLQPVGDGSYWQHEGAAFEVIGLPPQAAGTVTMRIQRVDAEPEPLFLFASQRPTPPAGVLDGSGVQLRPTMLEHPLEILDFETEYGPPRPALLKIPTYLTRIESLAPPWLPLPILVLLFVAMLVAVGYCFQRTTLITAD